MFKSFLTIMFYDPDKGWVEDSFESEVLHEKEAAEENLSPQAGS